MILEQGRPILLLCLYVAPFLCDLCLSSRRQFSELYANFGTVLQACAISACGNFAVLGTAGGWIERFNLQSGISRGSYVDAYEKSSCAHDGEVVGIACDSTNSLMISAGYHGDIKVDIILRCCLMQTSPTITFLLHQFMPKLYFLCCCYLCDECAHLVLWILLFLCKAENC